MSDFPIIPIPSVCILQPLQASDSAIHSLPGFPFQQGGPGMPRQSSQKQSGGSPRKKSGGAKEADAVEILKTDHEKVLSLFKAHQSASPDEQASFAKQIFNELELHAAIEEELFYPALREQGDLKEIAELEGIDSEAMAEEDVSAEEEDDEATEEESIDIEEDTEEQGDNLITLAYEDHKAVKDLITELKQLDPSSDQYRDRFTELRESVIDHVGEEEEVLFPEAKLKLDTKKLGGEIVKRRSDLASSMAA
jgi:hemerythrin superfamily protein